MFERGPGESFKERRSAVARRQRLELAQLPVHMREATRLFRRLTGFTAVASLVTSDEVDCGPDGVVPPVHPLCASLFRNNESNAPCNEQWRWHLRSASYPRVVQIHICPLGMRCGCIPIRYGERLVGVAKVVAGPDTNGRRFSLAIEILGLAVSRICQDLQVYALREEVDDLRNQMTELRKIRGGPQVGPISEVSLTSEQMRPLPGRRAGELVKQALDLLDRQYLDPALSLAGISKALGINAKYLTRLFTRVVGRRMHEHILGLRMQHACRLLLSTAKPIKEIGYESGFRQPERFRRAFREYVGVPPGTYRRIFAAL